MNYFAFITSSRFHALVIIGALLYGVSASLFSIETVQPILLILLGHIGIRTVDRFAENVAK